MNWTAMAWNGEGRDRPGRWQATAAGAVFPFAADPYWVFAELTNYAYLERSGHGFMPIIFRLNGKVTATQFARGDWGEFSPPDDWQDWLRVPSLYRSLAPTVEDTVYCTAMVREEFFVRLALSTPLRELIGPWELCLPVAPATAVEGSPPMTLGNGTSRAVIGVIDDGLAYAHQRFRRSDRAGGEATRIDAFWDQDDPTAQAAFPGYGRTLGKAEIDGAVASATHGGLVDEDEVYRRGGASRVGRRQGHGTHVLDLAAGEEPDVAPDAPAIVAVQLPSRTTRDTSGSSLASFAIDGLHYILRRSFDLYGGKKPIVVNLSYGMIAGPHDGSGLLEAAFDDVIARYNASPLNAKTPLRIVLPAGNSHLARCHARFELAPQATQELRWRILPDDWTPSFLELWLAPGVDAAVVLTPPGGPRSPSISKDSVWTWQPGANLLALVVYPQAPAVNGRHRVLVAVVPTFSQSGRREVAPAGIWQLEVTHTGASAATFEAWIQRDDTPFGFPRRGRQSRFEDDAYVWRDEATGRPVEIDNASHIKRAGSINAIATGASTVVVGGYRRRENVVERYSAGGPVVPPGRNAPPACGGPDVCATGADSAAHTGVLAAGTRTGSVFAMYGTSVAAPAITRWIAARMTAGQAAATDRASVAAAAWKPGGWPAEERAGAGVIPETLEYRMTGVDREEPT